MILTADVLKLKCVYFAKVKELVLSTSYGLECDKNLAQEVVNTIETYLDLLQVSPTICRSLECKILGIIESYTTPTPCVREVVGPPIQ